MGLGQEGLEQEQQVQVAGQQIRLGPSQEQLLALR